MGYEETVMCEASAEEGLVFIKVVVMPHGDAVEFDVHQARSFAERIMTAVATVESGWVGEKGASPNAGDA